MRIKHRKKIENERILPENNQGSLVIGTLDKPQAALVASFPLVAFGVLNHLYKAPLYALHSGWFWAADVLNFVVAPTLVWWLVLRPAHVGLADCGLVRRDRYGPGGDAWAGVLFLALLMVAWTWPAFLLAQPSIQAHSDAFSYHAAIPQSGPGRWLVPLYFSLSAALVEEVFYRALPWLYLEGRVSPRHRQRVYVWLTSIVFSVAHSEQGLGGMVATFWFGWVAARMYCRHHNLWPLLAAHFFTDMVAYGL